MAHKTFPVEVLTPEGKAFEGEVEMLSTRTSTGSIGIRANHAPLVLVDEIVEPDSLNRSDLETRVREAEQTMEQAEEDSEEYRRAERNERRYKAFLEIAEGG